MRRSKQSNVTSLWSTPQNTTKENATRSSAEVVRLLDRIRAKLPPLDLHLAIQQPDHWLKLATMYHDVRDQRSMLTCIYFYTAIHHPEALPDKPPAFTLGEAVLKRFREVYNYPAFPNEQEVVCAPE